jgi:pyruvate/2-oxoglutarate dehydrogenase complex dihydrolipoamide acyltransferase (E2) component
MSAIANLGSAAAALPTLNPHLHGHKKGSRVQPGDDTRGGSDSAAQVPAGLQQNLFGSLLNSLEQVICVQATAPAGAATAAPSAAPTAAPSAAPTAAPSAAPTGTPVSTANPVSAAAQSSLTLLQNYLNNLLHNPRTDGSQAAKPAGLNLNVSA